MNKIIKQIESLEELLSNELSDDDIKHKDEILDICLLLKQRTQMYITQYNDRIEE